MDKLSKQAAEAFSSGAEPKTEPPAWTENLGPAKPYDAFLDEKTPAQQWPASALEAFLDEHKDELGPFVQQAASSYGYGSGYSVDDSAEVPGDYAGGSGPEASLSSSTWTTWPPRRRRRSSSPGITLAEPGIAEDQFGRRYQWITGTPAQLASRSAVASLARAWGFRTPQVSLVSLEDGYCGSGRPAAQARGHAGVPARRASPG